MNILVIVAHPSLEESRANRALIQELSPHDNIHIHDLYKEYPNWTIDIEREQQLLLKYDRIVFQFPFYWYSTPPLLKKWFDDVLTYGWAFGTEGDHLNGKEFILAITVGASEQDYHEITVNEFLRPLEASIKYVDGIYLPSFVMYDSMETTDEQLNLEARRYEDYIRASAETLV
ncbi:general stress protein [Bacillus sp. FJAT-27264]|uniref:NAD(P)H-dependent oxidoreductase n=1 Tax=Paenibacillus sp. (strain DSM 101736 / FJAT-27264) TaxID=1850362 RepID=UPI000807C73F|nr:NAD(P)H-dependent oxidoreductase [Bacillus sp. FJAT-27264]OBZ09053.1 general stress protein [Bacillus sp. FJAT-27264]